jgi:hypothetical protein
MGITSIRRDLAVRHNAVRFSERVDPAKDADGSRARGWDEDSGVGVL